MTPGRAKEIDRAFQDVKRQLAAHSALAASLGCADVQRSCQVTSELSDAVRIADAGQSSLRPVIDLLAGFCVLVALGAALVAGVFTGRRRAAESRLSLVGGEPRPLFLARAGIEAALPAIVGSAAGFATAVELVRLFTPQGSVDGSVVREAGARVGASAIASMLAVAVGTTLARGRIGGGSTALEQGGAHPVGGVRDPGGGRIVARPGVRRRPRPRPGCRISSASRRPAAARPCRGAPHRDLRDGCFGRSFCAG